MGVAGLWEVLRPAGQVRSLTELAVEDGFNANPARQRGFRIGIDASIWFFHAAYGREGENPELRTLFFRCCRLLQSPLLPLFVFDGPNRPAIKRGKRVGGNAHWLTQGMKNIIEAFGFEWRVAPGEAEAELAYLNRIGTIDAVLSDDVDNFLFGATMVIRNPSNTLSGNRAHPVKNAQGKDDGNHVVVYTADAILSNPSIALSRPGTILIGLLSGGDYIPAGLPGCGQKFATGLARAGFGDSLMKAVSDLKGARLDAFLNQWREDLKTELKTNKSGHLPSKKPSLAASLPDDFPSLPVLMSYADPLTSENKLLKANRKPPPVVWRNDPDPMRIASICELYFEWGVKDVIVHRFRTVLWPGIVCRTVRRVVLDDDSLRGLSQSGTRHTSREEDHTICDPPSPTNQLSSAFSSVSLSSPSKKSSAASSSSQLSTPESFTLTSLIAITSAHPEFPSSNTSTLSPLLLEVVSQRTHTSTDATLEYRVLVDPTTLVERAESGVKGLRPPLVGGLFGIDPEDENEAGDTLDYDVDEGCSDDGDEIERLETAASAASKSGTKRRKARKVIPTTPLRLWLPACMVRAAVPALTAAYEEKLRVREERKAKRGAGRGRRAGAGVKSSAREMKSENDANEEHDSGPRPSTSRSVTGQKPKAKSQVGIGRGRRKPKHPSEAQNDEYEFIDLSAGESPCSSDAESINANIKGKGREKVRTKTEGIKQTTKKREKVQETSRKVTSVPRPPSKPNPVISRNLYEEEDSIDMPPLPKSSRPLDLLRAKRKTATTVSNLTAKCKSKSITMPKYEEESSSSPTRASGSRTSPTQSALGMKNEPLFIYVSDTDSDIEVSNVRRTVTGPLVNDETRVDISASVGETCSTIDPTPMTRSAPSRAHILSRQSPLESDEEGSEGDELPTFHRPVHPEVTRPAPRPFPMRLSSDSPVSSRLHTSGGPDHTDENDGDTVEVVDVFSTPRGPSPPRSPTPSPSPVTTGAVYSPRRSTTFTKTRQSYGYPTSPTKHVPRGETKPCKTTKQRHHTASEEDATPSGGERSSILKSPRKSAAHSSPRHVPRGERRAPSPTLFVLSKSPVRSSNAVDGVHGCHASDGRLSPKGVGRTDVRDGTGRKPRLSDTSAISISSGSDHDEGEVILVSDGTRGIEVEGDDDDACRDVDTWADTGMILSMPPSPAAPSGTAAVVPCPPRMSKFRPAPTDSVASTVDVPPSTADRRVYSALRGTVSGEHIDSRSMRRAPLPVARTKRSVSKSNDVIDLTSD